MGATSNLPKEVKTLDPGNRLGDIKVLADLIAGLKGMSTENAITASTVQTQVGAFALSATISRVTVANANDAVGLPRGEPGRAMVIINDSGQTIQLFPKTTGNTINDAAANASVDIANNTISLYVCPVAGKWYGAPATLET